MTFPVFIQETLLFRDLESVPPLIFVGLEIFSYILTYKKGKPNNSIQVFLFSLWQ